MKNKKSVLILAFLFLGALVFADNKPEISFYIEPSIGLINGTIVENVWYVHQVITPETITLTPVSKESRLDWQLQNAPYIDFTFGMSFDKRIELTFNLYDAFSGSHGVMEDYDWLNPIKWPNDPPDELTNYSWHTKIIHHFTRVNFLAGYNFNLNKVPLSITPNFGIIGESFVFSGFGGYYKYKSMGWTPTNFANTDVITYKQCFVAPVLLLNTTLDIKYCTASLDLSASYIKDLSCFDTHHEKGAFFNDRIKNAWLLQAGIKAFYKITEKNKIGIKANCEFIPDAYGLTYDSTTSFDDLSDDPGSNSLGGTSRFLFRYALVYQHRF